MSEPKVVDGQVALLIGSVIGCMGQFLKKGDAPNWKYLEDRFRLSLELLHNQGKQEAYYDCLDMVHSIEAAASNYLEVGFKYAITDKIKDKIDKESV